MKRNLAAGLTILVIGAGVLGGCKKEEPQTTEAPQTAPAPAAPAAQPEQPKTGVALFQQHCVACHPDGGNTVTPEHTLHKAHLKSHNITKPEDIVKIMRNPGPGMNKFDEATVPDKDATAIAEYILQTF